MYVNGLGFRFGEEDFQPGIVALIGAGGPARQVADGVAFPNGMVVTPDGSTLIVAESFAGRLTAFSIGGDGSLSNRRVWAELGFGGDGICLDAEGAIWTPSVQDGRPACLRVREGGEVLQRIELDRSIFACALGGADGCTLFMLVCDWDFAKSPVDNLATLVEARTGRVLTARAPAPGARRPGPDR